jgi:hypothetical protein
MELNQKEYQGTISIVATRAMSRAQSILPLYAPASKALLVRTITGCYQLTQNRKSARSFLAA